MLFLNKYLNYFLVDVWNDVVCFQPPSLLPTTQFAYRKCPGTCDDMHFCACPIHCRVHWRVGRRLGFVKIDFIAAFDIVNHQGILYKLCSVGNGGSVSSILTQFPSNRSQHVMVDGCHSKLVNVMSGVPQGSVLDQLSFLLYTSELFSIVENKLIG